MSENFYTVDPGISGLGLACFSDKKLRWWDNFYPKGKDFQEKTLAVLKYLSESVSGYSKLFIEWPTGRFSGKKGLAAVNSDSILKLTFLIGAICAHYPNSVLIPVIKWKGQISKEITQARAEVFFQQKGFKNHASDAVGIGQYVIKAGLV